METVTVDRIWYNNGEGSSSAEVKQQLDLLLNGPADIKNIDPDLGN